MIDIDLLFEKYFKKFLAENLGKMTEEEIEDKVPDIYREFGNTANSELGGKSPTEYFKSKTTEQLVTELKDCVLGGIAVSDFLYDEISGRENAVGYLEKYIDNAFPDELSTYCVNIIAESGNGFDFSKYVGLLTDLKTGESLGEALTEAMENDADAVKEAVISAYGAAKSGKEYLLEIMSKMSRDDRIIRVLLGALKEHRENIPLYLSFVVKYGDERALDALYEIISDKTLSYADYKELKLAIEEFGGEVTEDRDFTGDAIYKKLKN